MNAIRFDDEFEMDFRQVRDMSLDPQPAPAFHMMDPTDGKDFELLPVMTGGRFLQAVAYPVIVEAWGKKRHGRHRRSWEAQFTKAEREKISRYHTRFYRWHLVSGTPLHVSCRLGTLRLLQRAVQFFAGLS